VIEVLISLNRPASMSDSDLQAWISQQATGHEPAPVLSRRHPSDGPALLLRVALGAASAGGADERLADLMMDMRLLGLRPTIVSRSG
jgi:hypothetical protein